MASICPCQWHMSMNMSMSMECFLYILERIPFSQCAVLVRFPQDKGPQGKAANFPLLPGPPNSPTEYSIDPNDTTTLVHGELGMIGLPETFYYDGHLAFL